MDSKMVMESKHLKMVMYMRENLLITYSKGRESIFGNLESFIKDNLSMVRDMGEVYGKVGIEEILMRVTISKT